MSNLEPNLPIFLQPSVSWPTEITFLKCWEAWWNLKSQQKKAVIFSQKAPYGTNR